MNENDFFSKIGTLKKPSRWASHMDSNAPEPDGNLLQSLGAVHPRWARNGDLFWAAADTCEVIDPGFYRFDSAPNIGPCLVRSNIMVDDLIRLPDTAAAEVLDEFSTFWELRDKFSRHGFLHKRGILLWGGPGSGKTASLMLMAEDIVIHHNGIVCQIEHPGLAIVCLSMIRKIEPDRPIVALIEDLDALVERFGENQFLSLLDGENQVDRIVFVATTN